MYAILCACRNYGQAGDKPRSAMPNPQKSSGTQIDLNRLVFPYYEWVSKDTALAWVKKPDGSVVAVPLGGEHREDRLIGGLSDIKQLGSGYNGFTPYADGMKVSPDGSKVLYIVGLRGGPAGQWCVGTLNGTTYTEGHLIDLQGPNLVWSRNSKEWVTLVGTNYELSVVHYYIDGTTPPAKIRIKDFAPNRKLALTVVPDILGFRQDGIAIVTVEVGYPHTKAIDIYMVDLDKGRVLPEKKHVPVPKGIRVRGMSLSHSGDRIAWLIDTEIVRVSVKPGETLTDDILDVWLSNADGSDLKRLPGFPPHVMEDDLPGKPFTRIFADFPIRWAMDDAAISYLQEDRLRLVKVK